MTPAEHIDQIPIVTVSYNAPDLIEALLRTLRQFCPNPVYVIDGSRRRRIAAASRNTTSSIRLTCGWIALIDSSFNEVIVASSSSAVVRK